MTDEPLVMLLTNAVAANFTANCLLAFGAKPAMVCEPSEAAELAVHADALLVNLGTVTGEQAAAMRQAIAVANGKHVPWVLDPVGVQHLEFRRRLAIEFAAMKPAIIRGNATEIATLADLAPTIADSTVLLATDRIDKVRQGTSVTEIAGGSPLLQAVTATGCAQGAICAAFLGRGLSPHDAAVAASKLMKRAGELAQSQSPSPGSFQTALIDAIWGLRHD